MPDVLTTGLPALLSHPDFQAGVRDAQEQFPEDYAPAPLTLDQMIEKVENNLSRHAVKREQIVARAFEAEPPPYLYWIGYVCGTIDQGLSFA